MDAFALRKQVITDYTEFVRSFVSIRDQRIDDKVQGELDSGLLWPDPLIQVNPAFEPGPSLGELVAEGTLHPLSERIFRRKEEDGTDLGPLRFHRHQAEAIQTAGEGRNYVLTTGTGSGKSLAYIVPIVDHVLRHGSGRGIQAIVVYPMNALANSQLGELEKFLKRGFGQDGAPVTFRRYTGQESQEARREIQARPPDILLTNYVMLELILTRQDDRRLVEGASDLRFLVLDELHTYRGRQGADVSMLVRRVREASGSKRILHVGTSATLASDGTWRDQQVAVAGVASDIFGSEVRPDDIIGETLRRITVEQDLTNPKILEVLASRTGKGPVPSDAAAFRTDPLASWIESRVGLAREEATGRLVRSRARPLRGREGLAEELAGATGVDPDAAEQAIRDTLLAGYRIKDEQERPTLAFRLHQFVSKGQSVYCSPEAEDVRHITLRGQQFVPGSNRTRVLLPAVFCRECGQDYYVVRRTLDPDGARRYVQRELSERVTDEEDDAGFLYISEANPWPRDPQEELERLPEAWLEEDRGVRRVRASRRDRLPREVFVAPDGTEGRGSQRAHFLRSPFLHCLCCGVSYEATRSSDYGKLASLGTEGRSSAISILTLSAIRRLRKDTSLTRQARKLLSFTDNRQDASLQAGHFNDLVEIALVRSALWRAVERAGREGLRHDDLPEKVFRALALPRTAYAINPDVQYLAAEETDRALRMVLSYYLYRDLRRGWRLTSPNLEQCGLLRMDYASLDAFCQDEGAWTGRHPALVGATPGERAHVCRTLLDYLRRELALAVDALDATRQERIQRQSERWLKDPWQLDPTERMEGARVALPRPRKSRDREEFVFLSGRGGFGQLLRRPDTFAGAPRLSVDDSTQVIRDLCEALTLPGLLQRVLEPRDAEDVAGYRVNAAGMIWLAGDGRAGFHDPIRMPSAPEAGPRPNAFFSEFYRTPTEDLVGMEAHEHTAQVDWRDREAREDRFRAADLPILFCSPTMELGVDIAELNVVSLRNVPPSPANYAQRSGRAGRGGQPALVYTYCSATSPHDQHFFQRPDAMVSGQVTPPRLDLGNEDLLRSHLHAIWLATSGLDLRSSVRELVDVEGEDPTLELLPEVRAKLASQAKRQDATGRALTALSPALETILPPDQPPVDWITRHLSQLPRSFESALGRWRSLYRAAHRQARRQGRIAMDASRTPDERDRARRLRGEAERQLNLLLDNTDNQYSDFYSYRYFASEGFLPGYNFPRLPLSAFLPGRRGRQGEEGYLSRPRFLAISEFGPRAYIYHEGSRYLIHQVLLPLDDDDQGLKQAASRCDACGYLHFHGDRPAPDLCEECGSARMTPFDNLFRMENVATRRRDRITSDEEERQRLGYEIRTSVRWAEREGSRSARTATVVSGEGVPLSTLTYGAAATIARMNLGWRRRSNPDLMGFVLDTERGYWARHQAEDDAGEAMTNRTARVVPYVEDRKNALLVHIPHGLRSAPEVVPSLQAALKSAIQRVFQLEDSELAAEPLPSDADRRSILLFEASEGGAGVLRRLVEEPDSLRRVAREALELCHFDLDTLEDLGSDGGRREACEAACYDCLLSYYNQRDHRLLDRRAIRDILRTLASARVEVAPTGTPRDVHFEELQRLCQSSLEEAWLGEVHRLGLRLPSAAQKPVAGLGVQPDFLYETESLAVFVDGPVHDDPRVAEEDRAKRARLEEAGWFVLAFGTDRRRWMDTFRDHPEVFGPVDDTATVVPPDDPSEGSARGPARGSDGPATTTTPSTPTSSTPPGSLSSEACTSGDSGSTWGRTSCTAAVWWEARWRWWATAPQ